ncbi:hypothetical protein OHA72_58485 [Dactylosporangium sp. NBC_01737]|uniref:hypothetical protein n=1 Tax=Dactylosporangium sp. NBC_01737 TaxID=2975959 RepID=UPI002E11DC07|nr:hypothetical protein OHA72_58485 [Dactylosporangium sp. NBC_01737]
MTHPPAGEELGEAVTRMFVAADPVPARLLQAASSGLAWRDPDAALAALLLDSAVAGAPAGVRADPDDGQPRVLSFDSGDTVIDVEVIVDGALVRLVGQVSRPVVAPLQVRHTGGEWSGATDHLGRFSVPDLPVGPLRIRWGPATPDTAAVTTATFLT